MTHIGTQSHKCTYNTYIAVPHIFRQGKANPSFGQETTKKEVVRSLTCNLN